MERQRLWFVLFLVIPALAENEKMGGCDSRDGMIHGDAMRSFAREFPLLPKS
jgi:hypothetical protein